MSRPSSSGGNTLKNLVNDILDLALVESGALRLELERIDLNVLIWPTSPAHAREWAAKMGLTLELNVPPNAGTFLADARRLRQIVFNLLSNAFKYHAARRHDHACPARILGEDVQIAVADNGPGLAPEVKANVFERFSAKSTRAPAPARALAWRSSTASWNCMTAGSRSKAAKARWCAATCRAASMRTSLIRNSPATGGRLTFSWPRPLMPFVRTSQACWTLGRLSTIPSSSAHMRSWQESRLFGSTSGAKSSMVSSMSVLGGSFACHPGAT